MGTILFSDSRGSKHYHFGLKCLYFNKLHEDSVSGSVLYGYFISRVYKIFKVCG